jgi:thermitase
LGIINCQEPNKIGYCAFGRGRKVKKSILAIMLLMIILASNLGIVVIIRPSMAEVGKDGALNTGSVGKTGEPASQATAITQDQASSLNGSWRDVFERKPQASTDKWNFNDTNAWINYTFADGNKTRLIVGVGDNNQADTAELEKTITKYDAKIVNTVSIGGQVSALVVELPLASVTLFVGEVHVAGLASYVEPNMRVQAEFVPNDPDWSLQWGPQKIEADWAWNTTVGSNSILVAVVDTGIDYDHPDLAANYVPLGYNWVNGNSDPRDDFGHGTHCAGIIAAVTDNGVGISGLAQVRIMSEKVLDSSGYGYWDWVAQGIIHAADQGANIISMSLGGYGDSELVHEAVQYAYDKGVLVVAAAGNDDTNTKLYPAGYPEVVSVAATDEYDSKAWLSNWGDWIELSAPGVDIYSTLPTYPVTLDAGLNYGYLSGTSMACPHVAGVAALAWSLHPSKTRDWLRLWLRSTADDLGDPGFDQYYGYGRIDARNAVEQSAPAHELIAYEWKTPPYVEPGTSATINATILNYGENDETSVVAQLLASDSIVNSATIDYLASGNSKTVSLLWNPTVEGTYNVTFYVVPVLGETTVEDNVLWKCVYVGVPVKAVVLRSYGNVYGDAITNWQVLSSEWYLFGGTMVYIDYTTLNKYDITYDDIKATGADVLIISCAAGSEFTDSEVEAITRYVYEGHGLIATAGTFYYYVPNNNKLAPLFGLNPTSMFSSTSTDLLSVLNTTHPLFKNVPNPLVFPSVRSTVPYDGRWDSNELIGGKYLAIGHYQESAIVSYKGLVYISPWLEVIPPYYHHHLQLLYNAITWSRYQKPQHEIVAALTTPEQLQPGETTLVNATVTNMGLSDESNVALQLLIDGIIIDSAVIPKLPEGNSFTLSYSWKATVIGAHNVTAYAAPVPGEDSITNNVASQIVRVSFPPKILVLSTPWQESTGALDMLGYGYTAVSPTQFATVDLYEYNVLFVGWYPTEPVVDALVARAPDIAEWVAAGNGIVALSEFEEASRWAWLPLSVGWSDYFSGDRVHVLNQTHPVMYDLTDAELSNWGLSYHGYFVSYDPAWQALAQGVEAGSPITLAADYGSGRIVVTQQDPDFHLYYEKEKGAEKLLRNMIEWTHVYFEHDLAVSVNAPMFVRTGKSAMLNATVQNRGLNDETNVELQLLINDSVVDSTLAPELSMGAHCALSYSWTPTVDGVYNVTAYSPPVENETSLKNNGATQLAIAAHPMINPLEGQYANYTIYYTDLTSGTEFMSGQWNFTYLSYISPYQLNVTVYLTEESGSYNYTQVGWLIVNVFTRMVEQDSGIYWTGMWYPGWIETNVTTGSTINLLSGNAAVVGNKVIYVGARAVDCWAVKLESMGYSYSFYYDKASGLWIGMRAQDPYEVVDLRLEETNVPVGFAFAHDLALTLDVGLMIPMSESTTVNATVYNTGLSDEANIVLELLINGAVVDQLTIDELLVNQNRSLSYDWIPTSTGTYDVAAYAQPIPGEEYTGNNVATRSPTVFYYSRLYVSPRWVGDGSAMSWQGVFSCWQFDLPFDFPFYGIPRRTIYISSSGLITFDVPDSSFGNGAAGLARKLAIAPAWSTWETYYPCDIYVWENSTHVGIRWSVMSYYDESISANFEAILGSDGVIQLDYGDNYGTVWATVGISNGAGHIIAEDLTSLDHIRTAVFAPFSPPDVAISSIAASSYRVLVGNPVNVTVVAENHGMTYESFGVTAYASSSNSTRIYFDPSYCTLDAANVSVGDRFNVTLMVKNVEDLTGWQVRMFYDDSIINVTRWFEPTWDPEYVFYGSSTMPSPSPPTYVYNHWGPEGSRNGSALVFSGLLPFPPEQPSFTGIGKLCIFEFEVKAIPPSNQSYSCDLSVDNVDTICFDSEAAWSRFDVYENGNYWLGFGLPPTPLPPTAYVIGAINVVNLAPGSSTVLTFNWNTSLVLPHEYRIWAGADVLAGEINTDNNVYYDGTLRVLKAPIALFEYSHAGTLLTFDASSSTQGSGYITSYTWDFDDGNITTTASPVITHIYYSDRSYNVTLTIEDSEGLTGSTWKLVEALWHDVAVVDVVPYRDWVYETRSVSINVTVANKGDFAENVTVDLYYDVAAGGKIDTMTAVLAPNENITLTFAWITTGVQPDRNYTIAAVATITADITPADNTLAGGNVRVRILGDLNGDGKVDGRDMIITARAFATTPGDLGWNPDADINQDGKIDGRDMILIARNFGMGFSP